LLKMQTAVFCFATLSFFAPAIHASTTFAASATLTDGTVMSGNIVIDTLGGTVTSLDLIFTGAESATFTTIAIAALSGSNYLIIADGGTTFPEVSLELPVTSLVGYTGGVFCSNANPLCTPSGLKSAYVIASGSPVFFSNGGLTAPEPATLWVTAAGIFALVALGHRLKSVPPVLSQLRA
jgi:hypothetical protein